MNTDSQLLDGAWKLFVIFLIVLLSLLLINRPFIIGVDFYMCVFSIMACIYELVCQPVGKKFFKYFSQE